MGALALSIAASAPFGNEVTDLIEDGGYITFLSLLN